MLWTIEHNYQTHVEIVIFHGYVKLPDGKLETLGSNKRFINRRFISKISLSIKFQRLKAAMESSRKIS